MDLFAGNEGAAAGAPSLKTDEKKDGANDDADVFGSFVDTASPAETMVVAPTNGGATLDTQDTVQLRGENDTNGADPFDAFDAVPAAKTEEDAAMEIPDNHSAVDDIHAFDAAPAPENGGDVVKSPDNHAVNDFGAFDAAPAPENGGDVVKSPDNHVENDFGAFDAAPAPENGGDALESPDSHGVWL